MVFAMDSWYTYTIIIGARNQHTASGAYEFHIHRAYIKSMVGVIRAQYILGPCLTLCLSAVGAVCRVTGQAIQ